MDFPCAGLKMPKPVRELLNLLAHAKTMVGLVFFCLHLFNLRDEWCWWSFENHESSDHVSEGDRPSPLLVPVPYMSSVETELIKVKLPVVEFGSFLKRSDIGEEDEYCLECAICLNNLNSGHEIRQLSNCSHGFHRQCLDKWVDKGHVTCPLCRSKLLPADQGDEERRGEGDPWRAERIAYLFGEDYVMHTW